MNSNNIKKIIFFLNRISFCINIICVKQPRPEKIVIRKGSQRVIKIHFCFFFKKPKVVEFQAFCRCQCGLASVKRMEMLLIKKHFCIYFWNAICPNIQKKKRPHRKHNIFLCLFLHKNSNGNFLLLIDRQFWMNFAAIFSHEHNFDGLADVPVALFLSPFLYQIGAVLHFLLFHLYKCERRYIKSSVLSYL